MQTLPPILMAPTIGNSGIKGGQQSDVSNPWRGIRDVGAGGAAPWRFQPWLPPGASYGNE